MAKTHNRLKPAWFVSSDVGTAARRVANLVWAMLPDQTVLNEVLPLGMRITVTRKTKVIVQVTFREKAALARNPFNMAGEIVVEVRAKMKHS